MRNVAGSADWSSAMRDGGGITRSDGVARATVVAGRMVTAATALSNSYLMQYMVHA